MKNCKYGGERLLLTGSALIPAKRWPESGAVLAEVGLFPPSLSILLACLVPPRSPSWIRDLIRVLLMSV